MLNCRFFVLELKLELIQQIFYLKKRKQCKHNYYDELASFTVLEGLSGHAVTVSDHAERI